MRPTTTYRADIDGLRAVAVLLVLAFHINPLLVPGGFVGVDVFFVISGFLITRNILARHSKGSFHILDFFARRVKRLFPATLATVALSALAASLLFSPVVLQDFARSALWSLGAASNIYFWQSTGYFDAEAITKPLLHTWSLSVEWQFYLALPFLAWAALRIHPKCLPASYAVLGMASLAMVILYWHFGVDFLDYLPGADDRQNYEGAPYFLAPYRAFEFLIGGALAWLPRLRSGALSVMSLLVGFFLVFVPAFALSGSSNYPDLVTLAPCCGAFLIMWSGNTPYAVHILTNRTIVYVGTLSYSLYLVHWPVIVFSSYVTGAAPAAFWWQIALLSSALAVVLHHAVERPFMGRGIGLLSPRYALVVCATLSLTLFALSAQSGWAWRIPGNPTHLVDEALKAEINGALEPGRGCRQFCVFGDEDGQRTILVVGDSHANHLTKALTTNFPDTRFELFQSSSCYFGKTLVSKDNSQSRQNACETQRARLTERIAAGGFDGVIQSQRWASYRVIMDAATGEVIEYADVPELQAKMIKDSVANYADAGVPIFIVAGAPDTNAECTIRPLIFRGECGQPDISHHLAFSSVAHKALADGAARFIDTVQVICPDRRGCASLSPSGEFLYTDGHHLSVAGATLVTAELKRAFDDAYSSPYAERAHSEPL